MRDALPYGSAGHKMGNHVLCKVLLRVTFKRQSSSPGGGLDSGTVTHLACSPIICGALRPLRDEEPKSRGEVPEVLFNVRRRARYLGKIYSKFVKMRECGRITKGLPVGPFGVDLEGSRGIRNFLTSGSPPSLPYDAFNGLEPGLWVPPVFRVQAGLVVGRLG